VPPGLFTSNPTLAAGGTFTNNVSTDLVFYGLDSVTMVDTTWAMINGVLVSGYVAAGAWQPIPGANIGPTKVYYSSASDYNVSLNGLGLANINGANTAIKPSTGVASGFLATVTLFYIPL
jgi:hypothetical protein